MGFLASIIKKTPVIDIGTSHDNVFNLSIIQVSVIAKLSTSRQQTQKKMEAQEARLRNHQNYSEEPLAFLPSETRYDYLNKNNL